jgi:glycopeptide antibiotics resistance protein
MPQKWKNPPRNSPKIAEKRARRQRRRAAGWFVLAGALCGAIMLGTLVPGRHTGEVNLTPFVEHLRGVSGWLQGEESAWAIIDMGANLLLFLPFTLALARGLQIARGPRGWAVPTLLIGAGSSLGIETAQLFIAARSTDITDWILNSLGVAGGVLLMAGVLRVFPVSER